MADLIVGVVRNVLWHVAVKDLERGNVIGREAGDDFLTIEFEIDGREALVGGSPELRILYPQIRLDLLKRAQEREDGDVPARDSWAPVVTVEGGQLSRKRSRNKRGCACRGKSSSLQE